MPLVMECLNLYTAFSDPYKLVGCLLGYLVIIGTPGYYVYKHWEDLYEWKNIEKSFSFGFGNIKDIDGGIDPTSPHIIPIGTSEHILKIKSRFAFSLETYDLRFGALASDKVKLFDVDESLISLVKIEDINWPTPRFQPRPDQHGGFDCWYNPPIPIHKGGWIILKIKVCAKQSWKGCISLKIIGRNSKPHPPKRLNVFVPNTVSPA